MVLVHGLWLLASSWEPLEAALRDHRGIAAIAVDWPGDQATYAEAHAHEDSLAGTSVSDVADHVAEVIAGLDAQTGGDRPLRSVACWPR